MSSMEDRPAVNEETRGFNIRLSNFNPSVPRSEIDPLGHVNGEDEYIPFPRRLPVASVPDSNWTPAKMRRSRSCPRGMRIFTLGPYTTDGPIFVDRLKHQYGCIPICAADLFLGDAFDRRLADGSGTPLDYVMTSVLVERLSRDDVKEDGYVLTDFPRNAFQAKLLDEKLREIGMDPDIVIEMVSFRQNVQYYSWTRQELAGYNLYDDFLRKYQAENRKLRLGLIVSHYMQYRNHLHRLFVDKDIEHVFNDITTTLENHYTKMQHARRKAELLFADRTRIIQLLAAPGVTYWGRIRLQEQLRKNNFNQMNVFYHHHQCLSLESNQRLPGPTQAQAPLQNYDNLSCPSYTTMFDLNFELNVRDVLQLDSSVFVSPFSILLYLFEL